MVPERILIIKHGAFGDIILATAALKNIRAFHPGAHITVMTTKPFVSLLSACPWIDQVWVDERSHKPKELTAKICAFYRHRYDMVYDLQTSQRSSFYWWLMPWPKPKWSGIARFSSHRHNTAHRKKLHTLERIKEQLSIAGVTIVEPYLPDINWMRADVSRFALQGAYALLVPGGSAHRPEKRWPAEKYGELAVTLLEKGIQPVLIGSKTEQETLGAIQKTSSRILNLCDQTSFFEIAELARTAKFCIGNDTGPTHLASAAGCPTIALFATNASNPDLCAPKGKTVEIIARLTLEELSLPEVLSNKIFNTMK